LPPAVSWRRRPRRNVTAGEAGHGEVCCEHRAGQRGAHELRQEVEARCAVYE